MSLIRHRQNVVHAITPNNGNHRWLKGARYASGLLPVASARYSYLTTPSKTPPKGYIYAATGSLDLYINGSDLDGGFHGSAFMLLPVSGTFAAGAQSGVTSGATTSPAANVYLIPVVAWTAPSDGAVLVTITPPGA